MVLKLFRIRNQDIQQEQQGLPLQTFFRILHHEIIKAEKTLYCHRPPSVANVDFLKSLFMDTC